MGNSWVYLIPIVLLFGLFLYGQRQRRRQVGEEAARADRITVGTDVMTTSGLYGTVVARSDDGTVTLSIAPGVEVRWALAALRDAPDLPDQYRGAIDDAADSEADHGTGQGDRLRKEPGGPAQP